MKKAIAVATGLLAVSLTLIAGPSVAEPVDPQPNVKPELPPGMTQDEVVRSESVADTVANIESATEDVPGAAGFAVDEDNLSVTVHWKAPVPQVVMDAARLAEPGVTVTVIPAPWSLADASAATDRLIAAADKGTIPPPASMVLSNDAQTLRVGLDPLDANGKSVTLPTAADLRTLTGMPVAIVTEGKNELLSRINDSSPWLGGGFMRRTGSLGDTHDCSIGFPVLLSGTQGRLLSAAHCDPTGNAAWADGTGSDQLTLGGSDVSVLRNTLDTMIMDPVGGTDGYVHGGGWNATSAHSRYHLKVAGWATSPVGQSVCTSGANSGEHCGATVAGNPATFNCSGGGTFYCQGQFVGGGSTTIMVGGDSGGPVYFQRSDGRVSARGIIDAGAPGYESTCPSMALAPAACYRGGYMVSIGLVLNYWSSVLGPVTIETQP